MRDGDERKNGNFTLRLEDGGLARKVGRPKGARQMTTGEWRLDRELVSAFARLEGENGNVPSRGVQDIRERRHAPWRALARRFVEAAVAGVPKEHVLEIPEAMARWIEKELYSNDDPRAA